LTMTSGGNPATTVDAHTVVTLTATVTAGSTPVKVGQVKFCDAAAPYCEDSHLLFTAQLTAAGTAVTRFIPAPGNHSYNAVFAGTRIDAPSASPASSLTVLETATYPTKTTIQSTGSSGAYTLTSTVSSLGAPYSPIGTAYFLDTSDSNALLGSGKLEAGISQVNWAASSLGITASPLAADFNNDGKEDLAYTSDDTLFVMLGNGDGTFGAPISSTFPGTGLGIMTVGDFNADGNADLAMINLILLGNGDGTFRAAPGSLPVDNVWSIVTGDFNGDGIADLAVTNWVSLGPGNGNEVTVLLGRGDGTFWTSQTIVNNLNYTPKSIAAADFDGDGYTDLAWLDDSDAPGVSVAFGKGDGTFQPPVTMKPDPYGHPPVGGGEIGLHNLVVADFNGDGRPDMAIGASFIIYPFRKPPEYFLNLGVLLSHRNRQFTLLGVPNEGGEIWTGDFNGDGIPDLVAEYGPDGHRIPTVLLGNGDGTFTVETNSSLGDFGLGPLADFTGDGIPDLAVTMSADGSVDLLTTEVTRIAAASASGTAPVGDGVHKVVAHYVGETPFTSSTSIHINLTGLTAPAPVATLSTTLLQFGDETVKVRSNALTAILTNTGTAPLLLGQMSMQPVVGRMPPFATSNNCPASLAVGASCKIRFRFYPFSAGEGISQLLINDNAGNSPQVITLTGTAVPAP